MALGKTEKVDWVPPPAPTTRFLSSICSGVLPSPTHTLELMHKILSFCSLMCTQQIIHMHAHKHTALHWVPCRSRTRPSFLLSQECRTIVILHQPFRNLLCLLFQWCRPEALVLQLRRTVYMIKCSICSYISWANSDKCYQSSYFSD